MSLINEALKRAKEAQDHAPPPGLTAAHLRPVEPAHSTRQTVGLLLPIGLTLIALTGLFFLWRTAHENSSDATVPPRIHPAAAMALRPAGEPAAPARTTGTASAPVPVVARSPEPAATTPPPAPGANALSAAAPTGAAAAPASVPAAGPAGRAPASAQAAPPPPTPLRLQGIVYHPTRPSAVVNGKTVFVGDHVGEYRVLAISSDSATLVAPTCTNVLRFSE